MRSIYNIEFPSAVMADGHRATALKWSRDGKKILIERGLDKYWLDLRYVEPIDTENETGDSNNR